MALLKNVECIIFMAIFLLWKWFLCCCCCRCLRCCFIIVIKFHLEHLPGFLSPFQIADTALTADTRPWNELYTLFDRHKTLSFFPSVFCTWFALIVTKSMANGWWQFSLSDRSIAHKKKRRICWTRRWWIIAIISGVSHIYYYWHYAQTVVLSQSPRVTKCETGKKNSTRYQSRKIRQDAELRSLHLFIGI